MNEREKGESSVEQFMKAIEARLDVDDDDAHVLTRDGFELLKSAWRTRAAPPATTAGAVDEIVREIDGIFHRWQTEAAPGTCMSDLHHAWNRLRAALSSRTSGAEDVTVDIEKLAEDYYANVGETFSQVALTRVLKLQGVVAQRGKG